jgi:Flp pilus assembly protein TadD
MGRKKDARNAYLKCLKRDPRNVLALNNLAINYYEDGEAGKAVEMLNKALEIDPGYKDARNNLAKMLSQKAGEGAKKR